MLTRTRTRLTALGVGLLTPPIALGVGLLTPPIQGPITAWPKQVIGRESPVRGEYLQAIRAADDGDYEPLFELHRRFTARG